MGFLLLFGGLIAASWILFGAYVVHGTVTNYEVFYIDYTVHSFFLLSS